MSIDKWKVLGFLGVCIIIAYFISIFINRPYPTYFVEIAGNSHTGEMRVDRTEIIIETKDGRFIFPNHLSFCAKRVKEEKIEK